MKTLALGHFHGETQTLGVSNWKFCSRTRFWGATVIFPIFYNGQHQICISVDTWKTGDPNFRGVGNWKFHSRTHFWGAMAIFPIFYNGRHQFCVSVDTRKTGDPNFRGSVIGSFALGCIFGELRPFFPFSVMADTNFVFLSTLRKPETQTLGGR